MEPLEGRVLLAGISILEPGGAIVDSSVFATSAPHLLAAAQAQYSLWSATAVPTVVNQYDAVARQQGVELGVKFRADVNGSITGLRYYKGSSNTGTHLGHLWSSDGTLLATATFTNEGSSGWQQVSFASPVPILANTTYLVSYHTNAGYFADDMAYFANAGVDSGPLHALRNGVDGSNGVYAYGGGSFPTSTYRSSNYWVDALFSPDPALDSTPPTVTSQSPAPGASGVALASSITVSFSEPVQPASLTLLLGDPNGNLIPATLSYSEVTRTATLTPDAALAAFTRYTATLSGAQDLAGNALAGPLTWSFTTLAVDSTPPVIASVSVLPSGNQAAVSWLTNEPARSRIDYGLSPQALNLSVIDSALVGTHLLTLTGLTPNTVYYYRVSSTDAAGNSSTWPAAAEAPASFTTPAAVTQYSLIQPDGSTASGWMYSRQISVQNTGESLKGYQVRITLDSSFPFARALSDGSDVRIVDASGKVIPYWIQSWDPAGLSASIWVRVPLLAGGATTPLFIYYGNPAAAAFDLPPTGPFVKFDTNPILPSSSRLPENIVQDPSTGRYWMAYTGSSSSVGLAWAANPEGPWTEYGSVLSGSSQSVSTSSSPHLMLDHGTWYLYYANKSWDIALATAAAVTGPYVPLTSAPQLARGTSGSWDDSRVMEPYVLYDGTQWRMLYMGDAGSTTEQVGQATAPNPWGPWTKDSANPVIGFGALQSYDAGTVADPFVYKFGDTWYVFYAASETKGQPWENAVATTQDFVTFTKGNIVLSRGSVGQVDDNNAHRGGLIRIGDDYYMSYTGVRAGDSTYRACMARQYAKSTASGYPAEQVLDAYSDFTGTSLPDTWYQGGGTGGTHTLANGVLTIHSGAGTYNQLQSGAQFGVGTMIEVRLRVSQADGTGNHSGQIGLGSLSGGDPLVRIRDYDSATWEMLSGSASGPTTTANMAETYSTGWVTLRVAWADPGTIKYQVDGHPWEQLTTNVPPDGSDLHAYLMAYAAPGYTTDLEVDWVMVHRYAATEPTVDLPLGG